MYLIDTYVAKAVKMYLPKMSAFSPSILSGMLVLCIVILLPTLLIPFETETLVKCVPYVGNTWMMPGSGI